MKIENGNEMKGNKTNIKNNSLNEPNIKEVKRNSFSNIQNFIPQKKPRFSIEKILDINKNQRNLSMYCGNSCISK